MKSSTMWVATAVIITAGVGLYAVALGASVLVFIVGLVAMVVVADVLEQRELAERARRERLRTRP